MDVRVTRVYDPPGSDDGARVLVDRLWPRGLARAKAALDEWDRAVAPSTELREWYGHDPDRFEDFAARYEQELEDPERAAAFDDLRRRATGSPRLTLLTAVRAVEISHAEVLRRLLTA